MDLHWIDGIESGRLAVATRPRGGDWLEDDLSAARADGVEILLSMLTADEEVELGLGEEESLAGALGMEFVRLPVPDYSVPVVEAVVPTFRMLVAQMNQGRALAIHCRMGVGRSTLAAASLLTLLGCSPDDAWTLVQEARGGRVPDTEAQRRWVYEFARLHAP